MCDSVFCVLSKRSTRIAWILSLVGLLLWISPQRESAGESAPPVESSPTQSNAGKGPIHIESDRMEAVDQEGKVIFSGHVVATRDDLTIHADRLDVSYSQATGIAEETSNRKRVREIVATGEVRITQKDIVATGERAVYQRPSETVVLTGNPEVWQGENRVRGQQITVFLNENRSVAQGNKEQRVEAVVYSSE